MAIRQRQEQGRLEEHVGIDNNAILPACSRVKHGLIEEGENTSKLGLTYSKSYMILYYEGKLYVFT